VIKELIGLLYSESGGYFSERMYDFAKRYIQKELGRKAVVVFIQYVDCTCGQYYLDARLSPDDVYKSLVEVSKEITLTKSGRRFFKDRIDGWTKHLENQRRINHLSPEQVYMEKTGSSDQEIYNNYYNGAIVVIGKRGGKHYFRGWSRVDDAIEFANEVYHACS
jgi:hypothetical protein